MLKLSKSCELHIEILFTTAPLAPVIDTQRTLAYDQLFLCWRLPQDSAPAWHFSVEYRRRGVVPGGASRGGIRGGLAAARWGWQRLDDVSGSSAVIDRLEMDSVYVLRVRGCNKAGYGEYSEEVYLHTPPAPGERAHTHNCINTDALTLPKGKTKLIILLNSSLFVGKQTHPHS